MKNNLKTAWSPFNLTQQGTGYNDGPQLARAIATVIHMNEQ